MKKITEFSVNYPVSVLMIVLAVILLGYISFDKLSIDLFPSLNSPRLFIELQSGEKPPSEIEKQYVENLESLAIRQSDVIEVSSICKSGSAQITVSYSWGTDMDGAFLDLQKATSTFAQNQDIEEINITQHDPNTTPVVIIGLSHVNNLDMDQMRKVAEGYIRNELIRLEGVADVEVSGADEKEIRIETEPYLLEAYQLTLDELSNRIAAVNNNVSGGTITETGLQYVVKGISLLNTIEDFEQVIVGYRSISTTTAESQRAPIFLRDVAKISYANKETENIVRLNGKRCLGLSVYKETKTNTVKAVDEITTHIADIEKALPGYTFNIISNQGTFIKSAINEVEETALIGIILAVIILYFFLRRIGLTLIISIAIPISIIATFNLMYFNGLSLNIMTLGGLALGAGMLVDNAIVVMENIYRNHENGMSAKNAAILGTSQVSGAITASTITTIIVFLPVVYIHGASGELFRDQAWTVAFSLISSLVVAILVIPMLYNYFFKDKTVKREKASIKMNSYGKLLEQLLDKKLMVIGLALLLVVSSAFLFPFIGTEFMPRTQTKEFSIEMKMPEGTKLDRTKSAVINIESVVSSILKDDLMNIYSHIGPSTGLTSNENDIFEGENTASIKVILNTDSHVPSDLAIAQIQHVLGDIPGVELEYIQDATALNSILGTETAPMVVEVKGNDIEVIENLASQVKAKMQTVKGVFNVQSAIEQGAPEVEIVVDRLKAGMYNMSVSNVVSQVQDRIEGKLAGDVEHDGELKDITIKLPDYSLVDLHDMTLSYNNQQIRLDDIAQIKMGSAPKEIFRRNQVRIGKITAQLEKDVALDKMAAKVEAAFKDLVLPPDYTITVTGDEEKRKESMASLSFALILSIILVYMVLASQFESLLHPFTILLTIPLAVVGSVIMFFILQMPLNIMAIIGIIMLVGIAVNDSIILIDRINQLKKEGYNRREAIVYAGQQRIRPIIMTSLTTILALLPLTFGFGESASLRSPMALAVISGLVTSTLLTLVVIPCVYDVFDKVTDKKS